MSKKPFSMPLYVQDFDMDTADLTCEEVGLFLRLLMTEWINGPLPNDHKKLARICRMSTKKFIGKFKNVVPKFTKNGNGFLINKKLEEVRTNVDKWQEQKRKAGIASAKKRWG